MRTSIQGVSSRCVALPAENCRVGDYRVWNGGSRTKLISITPKGKTQLTMVYESDIGNGEDVRVLKRTTPVVMVAEGSNVFLTVEDRPVEL
jgi:hypothetical protein